MAADLDQPSDPTIEQAEPPAHGNRSRRGERTTWGTLALVVLAAVIIIVILTQCTARVPNVVGLDRKTAESRLKSARLSLGDVSATFSGTGTPGLIDQQAPDAGVMLRTGGTVDIVVNRGTDLLTVPDVTGHDSADATVELQQAGFTSALAEEYSDTIPLGAAISQSPRGGTSAPRGSVVTVFYSVGPQADANASVPPSNSNGGSSSADGTTGSSQGDTPIFSTSRAYPGATAWSSGGDIYVRLIPGGGTRRVTSTPDWDTNPVVAPGGRYVVFLRAPSSGAHPTAMGAVSFTSFTTHLLTRPVNTVAYYGRWLGPPVFAPTAGSTALAGEWIVYPEYFIEGPNKPGAQHVSARLLISKVRFDSTWSSWNLRFRPAHTLGLSRSSRAGSVRVRQWTGGHLTYDRNLYLPTGVYLR